MNGTQLSYKDLINTALDGLKEVADKTTDERRAWMAAQPLLPPMVPSRRGGFRMITWAGLSALREFGRTWFDNDKSRAAVLSRSAAQEVAVRAFGELLEDAPHLPDDFDIEKELLARLEQAVQVRGRREHFYFPARVFEQDDVDTFAIGPVTFYRRSEWLDIVEQRAGQALFWKDVVEEAWSQETLDEVDPESRADRAQLESRTVIEAVGPAEWVLSVTVQGRDRSRSEECASVAALVALDSVGLSMRLSLARNLRGPGQPVEIRTIHGLSQFDGSGLNESCSIDVPQIGGRPGAQAALLHDTRKLREAVGDALTAFVSVQPQGVAPAMKRRWVEAMYWYGQARRERTEFIALVKIGVALDILAKGGRSAGILGMACAVLDKQVADPITTDQRSIKSFVKKLYDEGRSRIAHGGSLALLAELSLERHLADAFAAQILVGYVACLHKYRGADTYEDFRRALPSIRKAL